MQTKIYTLVFLMLSAWAVNAQKTVSPKSSGNSDITKSLNQKSLKEFGVNKDSVIKNYSLPPAEQPEINSTKDLNAQELEKIKEIDVKSKPIINQDSVYWYYKRKWEDSVAAAEQKQKEENSKSIKSPKQYQNTKTEEEMFISQPVIKGSKNTKNSKSISPDWKNVEVPVEKPSKSKVKMDSMLKKPVKDFSFETHPIISGKTKVSYSPDKPPKPEPTTITSPQLSLEQEKARLETYNSYQREADSVRYKNKKWMDSVLASLSVKAPLTVEPKDYIEIYMSGGGLVSGANPKITDRISIFQSGVIQREYTTQTNGEVRYEKKISKDELVKLAQYIADMGFFDFKESYACNDDDCLSRMKTAPQPRPLSITVAINKERLTVNVDIFAPGVEKNRVSYPPVLEKIVEAIYSVAEK